jgi:hypothetical protein
MTLKWEEEDRGAYVQWTAKASRGVGGHYDVGPLVSDYTQGRNGLLHYPVFYLSGRRSKPHRMGRYLEPLAATLAQAMALAQADNDKIKRECSQTFLKIGHQTKPVSKKRS